MIRRKDPKTVQTLLRHADVHSPTQRSSWADVQNDGPVLQVTRPAEQSGIHEQRGFGLHYAIPNVNVAEDMKPGPQPHDGLP